MMTQPEEAAMGLFQQRARRRPGPVPLRRVRPTLETLEGRQLLATAEIVGVDFKDSVGVLHHDTTDFGYSPSRNALYPAVEWERNFLNGQVDHNTPAILPTDRHKNVHADIT